ncbi:CMGC/SRPK protein kinase [Fusarium verticillioides 7600]|uniref:non-specific serine/threonine protein kinase n=1 Tax=Gibberella moniliformis (strain M3125 / FGSC 7600) TaxID=334819 RepID=W7MR99_GIBM7|nr:CMGC/SRPK protein kinase [Fusarium verticillioides 7600]EWG53616.1 CMGC/SRPK protein kinase [Fusarium verticillioides 7600]
MASRRYLKNLPHVLPRLKTCAARSISAIPKYPISATRKSSTQAVPIPGRYSQPSLEDPLTLPTTARYVFDRKIQSEEEEIPGYEASRFYPVEIGEVFRGRYQAVTKLGYGSSSTIWLARDLRDRKYVALKIYVHTSRNHREIPVYETLSPILGKTKHPGSRNIRMLLGSFEMSGPDGRHKVLVHEGAQMSLRHYKEVFRQDGLDEDFVRRTVKELLQALDFIHTEAELVHTDIHPGNLLLGVDDDSQLEFLASMAFKSPVAREQASECRTIYLSRLMRPRPGSILLSDFGEARVGLGPHADDIMPIPYRAPEVIMSMPWNQSVDIWSVGLTTWDLLGTDRLFTAMDGDGEMYDAAHLAELIAALGPPPREFLKRNPRRAADFWDEQGKWKGLAPIPKNRSLQELERKLRDSSAFIAFLRRVLTWMPENRPTAKALLQDPWLMTKSSASAKVESMDAEGQ